MGLREDIVTNWEDKTLEYKGKKFYIVKQFNYKDKEYLCGINTETLYGKDHEIVFLYKISDDIYGYVDKPEDFDNLMQVVSGLFIGDTVEQALKKYKIN